MNHTNNRGIAKNIPNIEIKQKEYKYSKIKINIKQPYTRLFFKILVRLFTHKVHHNEDRNDSCECECQD